MKCYYKVFGLRYFGSFDWYVKEFVSDLLQTTKTVRRGYAITHNPLPWDAGAFEAKVAKRSMTTSRMGFDSEQKNAG
jgi:hypothetical protein